MSTAKADSSVTYALFSPFYRLLSLGAKNGQIFGWRGEAARGAGGPQASHIVEVAPPRITTRQAARGLGIPASEPLRGGGPQRGAAALGCLGGRGPTNRQMKC